GETTGVFQLESAGMKRYLKDLKPTVFEDIVAMVALYRPGPMQFIGDFIARKHGEKEITYPHDSMKNALENTYGILVYQEQVMQISKEVCGFTGGEADTLRKAIGKKNAELMAKMKDKMIEGGQTHSNIPQTLMEKFWKQLEDFAAYCFNKSHAACYGLISYWTAYLKAHYPDAFMAALMTSDADDIDRLAIEINECRHMGIQVLLPDINESYAEFAIVPGKNQIRFGMSAIKNVGVGAVEEILRARDEGGKFNDLMDFVQRVDTRKVNRKVWESLIKSGGFDSLDLNRSDMLYNLDAILALGSKLQKDKETNQADLFGGIDSAAPSLAPQFKYEKAPEQIKEQEMLLFERELLGLYLSKHPLDGFDHYLEEKALPINQINNTMDSKNVTVGGVVTAIRSINTKNGSRMAFVKIEDKTGECEAVVFPGVYEKLNSVWEQDRVVLVKGRVNYKDKEGNIGQELKIIVDQANMVMEDDIKAYQQTGKKIKAPKGSTPTPNKVEQADRPVPKFVTEERDSKLYIHIKDPNDSERLVKIKQIALDNPGMSELILVFGESEKTALRMPFKVSINQEVVDLFKEGYEPETVILK
ncbi:DNA polymerase III subunit alpha, partial [Candidatus Saccharibacteria bacterium]|nr:DNA polymerase III subunit alpha [Candidatus Saccharibacteria bacterium]